MAWVSPTGYNDPDSKWGNEANAYDEDTDTFAYDFPNGYYLELTLESAISCDKVRIYCERYTSGVSYDLDVDVDVYYSAAWHNIHSGTVTKNTWVELSIGSTQTVDKARIKTNDISASRRIKEFDFNEVSGGTTHYAAAALSGTGALAALARTTFAATVTLAGTGSLAAIARKILSGISALAGTGSFIVNGVATLAGKATLAGAGLLAAAGTIEAGIKYGAATLAGIGALAVAGRLTLVGIASVQGAGALAASAWLTLAAKALFSGAGSLSAIGGLLGDVCGSAILAGQGSMSVIAESWHILTSQEYQDLLEGQIEFQEI
jgi:hypothetical protein